MDIQKKQVSVNLPVTGFDASVIVDSDAIVSDSKPDLLKIIQVDPAVRITKSDVLSGKMMIAGNVSCKILYQPENAAGVCNMLTTADFSHLEENADFAEGMYSDIRAEVEHVEWELINSRKIKLKCVITLCATLSCPTSVSLPLGITGDNLCIKYGDFCSYEKKLYKRDVITLSDSLTLPSGKPNIGSLLKSDVMLCNKDIKIISGKVIIKGDLEVTSLYVPEATDSVEFCRHNLPFTEILDAEGIAENDVCSIKTELEESDFSLATDMDGDVRVINSNIRIGVKICADTPVSERVVTDLYSLSDVLCTECSAVSFKKPLCSATFGHTVKCSVRPGNISSVCSITAKPTVTSAISGDSAAVLEGYMDISCLCVTQGEICPVTIHREEIPFKIESELPGCHPGAEIVPEIEVSDTEHILSPSGDLDIKIFLSCNVRATENGKMDIVEKVESQGPVKSRTPSIVLYFVQKDDTLWDIAKRYHTKTEYIQELNGDAETPLKCGSQLLIPRG